MGCDLSVIIVNWNTRDLLCPCIKSIKTHTKRISFEIIVIDNASSDGSPEAVEKRFPEVTLIKNKDNRGFGQANNQGLEKAKGKHILFLNSDVVIKENCLDDMFDFMERNPEVGASSCKLTFPDGNLQHSCRKFPDFLTFFLLLLGLRYIFPNMKIFKKYLMLDWDHSDEREVDQIMGSFMFIRKAVLDEVGHFDPIYWMYFEEVDLCLRIKKKGWKIMHFPHVSAIHFLSKSAEQWEEMRIMNEYHKSLLKYFKKNKRSYEYCILFALHKIKYLLFFPFLKRIKKNKAHRNHMHLS